MRKGKQYTVNRKSIGTDFVRKQVTRTDNALDLNIENQLFFYFYFYLPRRATSSLFYLPDTKNYLPRAVGQWLMSSPAISSYRAPEADALTIRSPRPVSSRQSVKQKFNFMGFDLLSRVSITTPLRDQRIPLSKAVHWGSLFSFILIITKKSCCLIEATDR